MGRKFLDFRQCLLNRGCPLTMGALNKGFTVFKCTYKNPKPVTIKDFHAKRGYMAFCIDFHFLQDQAYFWQTDLF